MSLWGSIFGWLNANSFSLLAAVYLAWAACLIGLACFVYALSRRLVRLSRQVEAQTGVLHKLSASDASRIQAIEPLEKAHAGAAAWGNGKEALPQISRRELRLLLKELSVDGRAREDRSSQTERIQPLDRPETT